MTLDSKLVFDAFLDWAKHSFEQDAASDFQRAKSFDGHLSKVVLRSLQSFSTDKTQRLARALPTLLWASHPDAENLIGRPAMADRQLADEFQREVQRLRQQEWQEFSNFIARKSQPEVMAEAQAIRMIGFPLVKDFAAKLGYAADKIDRNVWRLSTSKEWGTISVQMDFQSAFELTYVIFVHDPAGVPLRRGDHYLGVLGIGPSSWSIENREDCGEKVLKACEFVQWHVNEYVRMLETLQH